MASFDSDVIQPTDTPQGGNAPPIPLSQIIKSEGFQTLPKEEKLRAVNNFGARYGQNVSSFATVVELAHDATRGSRKDIRDTARDLAKVYSETSAKLKTGEISPADASRQWFDAQKKTNERRAAGAAERRRDLGVAQSIQKLQAEDFGFFDKSVSALAGLRDPEEVRKSHIDILRTDMTTPLGDIPNLTEDARRLNASEGVAHLTDGSLEVTDLMGLIENQSSYVEMIKGSGASESEKQRVLNNLPELRNEAIRQAWNATAKGGNVILGDEGQPVVSQKASTGGVLGDAVSDVATATGLGSLTSRDQQRELNAAHPQRFTLEEQEKAMVDFIESNRGFFDTPIEGLDQGFAQGGEAMVTLARLAGAVSKEDFAAFTKSNQEARSGVAALNAIREKGFKTKVAETVFSIAPQMLITRGVGSGAGGVASKFTSNPKTIAAISTNAALGVGAGFSFAGNAQDVLAKDPSAVGEAFSKGLIGFASTFMISKGFDKFELGGAESFKANLRANEAAFKKGIMQYGATVAKSAGGEFSEEFVDQYFNSLVTQKYTGKNIDDITEEAFMAGIAGGIFGGAAGVSQAKRDAAKNAKVRELHNATMQMADNDVEYAALLEMDEQAAKLEGDETLVDDRGAKVDVVDTTRTFEEEAATVVEPEVKAEAPKTEAPKAEAPKAEAPKAEAPKVEPKVEPKAEAPKVEPKAEAPKAEAPKAEAPKVEAPKAEAPKVEPKVEPKAEAPKVEPKAEAPKVEPKVEPKAEAPKAEAPKVEPKAEPKAEPKVEPKVEPKAKKSEVEEKFAGNKVAEKNRSIAIARQELRKVNSDIANLRPATKQKGDARKATTSKKTRVLEDGTRISIGKAQKDLKALQTRRKELLSEVESFSKTLLEADDTLLPARAEPRKASERVGVADVTHVQGLNEGSERVLNTLENTEKLPSPALAKRLGFNTPDNYTEIYNSLTVAEQRRFFTTKGDDTTASPDQTLSAVGEGLGMRNTDNMPYDTMEAFGGEIKTRRKIIEETSDENTRLAAEQDFVQETGERRAGDTAIDPSALKDGDVIFVDGESFAVESVDSTSREVTTTTEPENEFDDSAPVTTTETITEGTITLTGTRSGQTFTITTDNTLFVEDVIQNQEGVDQFGQFDEAAAFLESVGRDVGATFKIVPPRKEHVDFIKKFGDALGRRIVMFEVGGNKNIEGVADPQNPTNIYININARQPLMHVVGHETSHTLEQMDGYQEFSDFILSENAAEFAKFKKKHQKVFTTEEMPVEFVADVVGSRFNSKGFWQDTVQKASKGALNSFAKHVKRRISEMFKFLQGENLRGIREENLRNVERLDQMLTAMLALDPNAVNAVVDMNTPFSRVFDTPVRFLEIFKSNKTKNSTTFGAENTLLETDVRSLNTVHEYLEREVFDAENMPLDATGIKAAESLLAVATTPEGAKNLQEGLKKFDSDFAQGDGSDAMALAAARAAYFNYAARLAAKNPDAGIKLLQKGLVMANDFKAHVDSLSPDSAARFLGALRSTGEHSMLDLLVAMQEGKTDFINHNVKGGGEKIVKMGKEVDKAQVDAADSEAVADVADVAVDTDKRIAELEKRANVVVEKAHTALRNLLPLLEALRAKKSKFRLSEVDLLDQVIESIKKGKTLEDAETTADLLGSLTLKDFGFSPADIKKVESVTKKTKEATTSAKKDKKQVHVETEAKLRSDADKLGHELIGREKRLTEKKKSDKNPKRKEFNTLVGDVDKMTREGFNQKFVKLGGDPKMAAKVYDAAKTRSNRKAEVARARAQAAVLKKQESAAEKAANEALAEIEKIDKQFKAQQEFDPNAEKKKGTPRQKSLLELTKQFANPKPKKGKEISESALRAEFDKKLDKDKAAQAMAKAKQMKKANEQKLAATPNGDADKAAKKAAKKALAEIEKIDKQFKAQQEFDPNAEKKKGDPRQKSLLELTKQFANPTPKKGKEISESALRAEFSKKLNKTKTNQAMAKAKQLKKANEQKLAAKRSLAAEKRAERLVQPPKEKAPSVHKSLRAHIIDFVNNPAIKTWDAKERRANLKEWLQQREPSLTPAQIEAVVTKTMPEYERRLEEQKKKVARTFISGLESGKVDSKLLDKIVRLQVLDPSNDFATSFAAVKGYRGFTKAQLAKVVRAQRVVAKLGVTSSVGRKALFDQFRIVAAATGIPPAWTDRINSYIKGSLYSGISSQVIGVLSGASANVELGLEVMMTGAWDVLKGDPKAISDEMHIYFNSMKRNFKRAHLEAVYTARTGSSSVSQVQGGQEIGSSKSAEFKNTQFLDALTRDFDSSMLKVETLMGAIKNGENVIMNRAKLLKEFAVIAATSQRLTFRGLSAADASMTNLFVNVGSEIEGFRQAKKAGLSKAEFLNVVDQAVGLHDAFMQKLRNDPELDLSPTELQITASDKVNAEIYKAFSSRKVDINKIREGLVGDIQERIGTGATNNTVIGGVNNHLASMVTKVPFGAAVLPAVRTTGNIGDYLLWHVPVLNLPRLIKTRKSLGIEATQKLFPNIRTEAVRDRRRMMSYTSNVIAGAIAGLLAANDELPDDEKWFYFTGGYPLDTAERQRWVTNGWRENMLVLGSGSARTTLRMDRGVSTFLVAPLYGGSLIKDVFKGEVNKFGSDFLGLASALTPANFQIGDRIVALTRAFKKGDDESEDGLKVESFAPLAKSSTISLLQQAIPYRGLASIIRKNQDPFHKATQLNAVQQFFAPVAVIQGDNLIDRVNFLGVSVGTTQGTYNKILDSVGIPIGFKFLRDNDPESKQAFVIAKDFVDKGYAKQPKSPTSYKAAVTKLGKESTPAKYNEFVKLVGQAYAKDYTSRRNEALRLEGGGSDSDFGKAEGKRYGQIANEVLRKQYR